MKMGTTGIVLNELTQVLMIQRDDTRTWGPPGGALEAGELPDEGVAREVREETGLIVMPVRLVSLYYVPVRSEAHLLFSFRCIQRGGEIQPSAESPQVGWVSTRSLPRSVPRFQRRWVEQAFHHQGKAPALIMDERDWVHRIGWFFVRHVIYRYKDWQLARRGLPPYQPPPSWEIGAFVVIRNQSGQVLWVKRTDVDAWNLPGGGAQTDEPPWETAVRETHEETGLTVQLLHLTGVYLYHDQNHMVFTFTAAIDTGTLITGPEAAEFAYFAPGTEPHNVVQQHLERAADACEPGALTVFKRQVGPQPVIGNP